jgi:hypothetical protein
MEKQRCREPSPVLVWSTFGCWLPSYLRPSAERTRGRQAERVSAKRSELRSSRLDDRPVAELRRDRAGRGWRDVLEVPGLVLVVVSAGEDASEASARSRRRRGRRPCP